MSHDPSKDLQHLAEFCLAHLNDEEAFLRAVATSQAELHDALRRGDLARVRADEAQQQALADTLQELHGLRDRVTNRLGTALAIDGPVTLSVVAARLPEPWSARVNAARARLSLLAAEVQQWQKRNASLITYLRTYVRAVLAELSPAGQPTQRYGPSGALRDSDHGAVLLTRG